MAIQSNQQLVLAVGPVSSFSRLHMRTPPVMLHQMRRRVNILLGAWIVDGAGNPTRVPNNPRA